MDCGHKNGSIENHKLRKTNNFYYSKYNETIFITLFDLTRSIVKDTI
jgi:hypothetical protein